MPRQKSPKADNLTNAMATLSTAVDDLVKATNRLNAAFDKKDHKEATAALAEVHLQVLHCKDSSNHTYSHLSELRPKTEPKPPRKDKAERPSDGEASRTAAKSRREERNDKKRGPQRDEQAADEPSDPDAV